MNAQTSPLPRWQHQDKSTLPTKAFLLVALLAAAFFHKPVIDAQPCNSPRNEDFSLGTSSRGESKIPFLAANGRSHIKLDFIPVDERMNRTRRGYPSVTAPEGAYGVEGHGTPDSVFCRTGEPMSARELAKWIRNDSRYHTGMPVYLMCCETGKGNKPFAQRLADALGGEVMAPTEKLWPLKTGLYIVAQEQTKKSFGMFDVGAQRADITRLGMMRSFRPGQHADSVRDTLAAAQTPPSRAKETAAVSRTTTRPKLRPSAKTAALLASVQNATDQTQYLHEYKNSSPPKETPKVTAAGKPEAPSTLR